MFGMLDYTPIDKPLSTRQKVTKEMGPKDIHEVNLMNILPYVKVVCCNLLHVCNDKYLSRPCFFGRVSCLIHGKSWISSLDSSKTYLSLYRSDQRFWNQIWWQGSK